MEKNDPKPRPELSIVEYDRQLRAMITSKSKVDHAFAILRDRLAENDAGQADKLNTTAKNGEKSQPASDEL